MNQKIIIGLITYKRPKMLKKALLSLRELENIDRVLVEIVIVDNDKMATAEDVVNECIGLLTYPVHYQIEGTRGIPLARNKVIEKAIELGASELAFFDDDEIVKSDWLAKLYNAYKLFDSDVVTGPVVSIYPINTPKWVRVGKFYERKRFETGTKMPCAATGNILFNMDCFKGKTLRFDEKLALTGGSDSKLTKELVREGYSIRWVNESVVFEMIPSTRLNIKWILQRNHRIHLNGIKHSFAHKGLFKTYFFSIMSFVKNVMFGLLYMPASLVSSHYMVKSLISFTRCYTIVGALLFNVTYEEYKTIHGE